jgi:hypothetical protein
MALIWVGKAGVSSTSRVERGRQRWLVILTCLLGRNAGSFGSSNHTRDETRSHFGHYAHGIDCWDAALAASCGVTLITS